MCRFIHEETLAPMSKTMHFQPKYSCEIPCRELEPRVPLCEIPCWCCAKCAMASRVHTRIARKTLSSSGSLEKGTSKIGIRTSGRCTSLNSVLCWAVRELHVFPALLVEYRLEQCCLHTVTDYFARSMGNGKLCRPTGSVAVPGGVLPRHS